MDVFAPVAAHLANGVPLADLGPAVRDPVRIALPQAERTPTGWRAHVIAVDHFGNLATDLPAGEVDTIGGFVYSLLGHVPQPGERFAYNGLEITVEQVDGQRIEKVKITRAAPAAR